LETKQDGGCHPPIKNGDNSFFLVLSSRKNNARIAHFLIGEPLTQLPAAEFTDVKCNRLSRWQTYQQQLQQFWQRWSSDYLQSLQQRQRWQRTPRNLQPGDLVLLREDNTTPLQWPTAVIKETHPEKDGIVRVVTLRTPQGSF